MTDETTPASAAAETEGNGPAFAVQRIYLKDLSFETPMGAAAFQKQWQPKVLRLQKASMKSLCV